MNHTEVEAAITAMHTADPAAMIRIEDRIRNVGRTGIDRILWSVGIDLMRAMEANGIDPAAGHAAAHVFASEVFAMDAAADAAADAAMEEAEAKARWNRECDYDLAYRAEDSYGW